MYFSVILWSCNLFSINLADHNEDIVLADWVQYWIMSLKMKNAPFSLYLLNTWWYSILFFPKCLLMIKIVIIVIFFSTPSVYQCKVLQHHARADCSSLEQTGVCILVPELLHSRNEFCILHLFLWSLCAKISFFLNILYVCINSYHWARIQ